MDQQEILRKIHLGELNELEISWKDYQNLIAELVSQGQITQTFGEKINFIPEVSNSEKDGVIDVIVRFPRLGFRFANESIPDEEDVIFIECKRRNRRLEFDVVGKVFCHAMIERPRALYIVSPKPLSFQALEYAEKLFTTDKNSHQSSGLFKEIFFSNRSLTDLIGREAHNYQRKPEDNFIELIDWRLVQETTFGSEVIARPDVGDAPVRINIGSNYRFDIMLHNSESALCDVTFSVHSSEQDKINIASWSGKLSGKYSTFSVPITHKTIEPFKVGNMTIERHDNKRKANLNFSPFLLQGWQSDNFLGDLREEDAENFAHDIARSTRTRVVSISGEGGVGKSTYCEKSATILKQKHNFKALQFTLGKTDGFNLFFRIIESLILPDLPDINWNSDKPSISPDAPYILQTALHSVMKNISKKEIEQFVNDAALGHIDETRMILLVDCLAGLIRQSAQKWIIVLRDCHKLPEITQNFLAQLFRHLEDTGWSGIHFFLEHRSKDADGIALWQTTLETIHDSIGERFDSLILDPLSEMDLMVQVCSKIETPNVQRTAFILHRQTGGNPMFLDHLLRQFIGDSIMVRNEGERSGYRIDHFDLFERSVKNLPKNLKPFLNYRLKSITEKHSIAPELLISYLGLAAIQMTMKPSSIQKGVDEIRIQNLCKTSHSVVEEIRYLLLTEGILATKPEMPPVVFIHDIMQLVTLNFVATNQVFLNVAYYFTSRNKTDELWDQLINGRIEIMLSRFDKAEQFFNDAYNISYLNGNFLNQRLCLEGAIEASKNINRADNMWSIRRMSLWQKLIWNELQQGSQSCAQGFINEARTEFESTSIQTCLSDPGVISHINHKLDQHETVLATRQADMEKFVFCCERLIKSATNDSEKLFGLTRLILFSLHSNNTLVAKRAIKLSLQIPSVLDNAEVRSSFLSDLGQCFFLEYPSLTEKIWSESFKVIEGAYLENSSLLRQREHARVNLAVIEVSRNWKNIKRESLDTLRTRLVENGVSNPLIRLLNVMGFHAYKSGEITQAIEYWQQGLALTRSTSSLLFQWFFANNIAIVEMKRGNWNQAISFFRLALEPVANFIHSSKWAVNKLDSLVSLVDNKLEQLEPVKYEVVSISADQLEKPTTSGTLNRLVFNINQVKLVAPQKYSDRIPTLGEHNFNVGKSFLKDDTNEALKENFMGETFFFSIE